MTLIILVLFASLLFSGIHLRRDNEKDIFSIDSSQSLRGLSAIEITLGHIGIATQSIFLFPNRKAGILFVGIFFFLSGYGLIYSLKNKENYISNFFRKRFFKIFLPAYTVYMIVLFIKLFILQIPFEKDEIVKYIIGYHFADGANWYIVELIVMYALFQICYKYFQIHYANYILLTISLLFVLGAFAAGLDNPWYGSTLCFNIGLFYGEYKEKINDFFWKNFWIKNIFCMGIMLAGILGFFLEDKSFWGNVLFRSIASTFWILWLISSLQRINFSSKLCNFLGSFSYEIYLIHPVVILLLSGITQPFIFSVLCLAITIMIAWLYHKLLRLIW